jgi:uncharacterized protein YjbI with pentapeptide repeats
VSAEATATKRPWYVVIRDILPAAEAGKMYGLEAADNVEKTGDLNVITSMPSQRLGLFDPSIEELYREQDALKETPLIVLSSKEEAETKAKAFALGANDYLVKLPDPVEVVARLRHHSEGYKALRERNAAFAALAASDADLLRLEQNNSCTRCDLTAAALSHADLYGVAISETDLSGADLSGSLMNDARLVESKLVDANLRETYLTGADLSGSVLTGADLRQARLTNTILRGSILRDAQLDGADLSSADLRQAQLVGAHLAGASLAGSLLQNADLSNADLRDADLRHADLRQARLEGAVLCGADLNEALMPDGRRADGPPQSC